MSERYGALTARIDAVRQLGAVVNVMRGTAGARVAQAREGIDAVKGHAAVIDDAIRRVLSLLPAAPAEREDGAAGTALVVFGAEQGFVGGFTERVLDALGEEMEEARVLLVGSRAEVIAAERRVSMAWTAPMPLHISGIPQLADGIVDALFRLVAEGTIRRLETAWSPGNPPGGGGPAVERRRLFPLSRDASPGREPPRRRPLLYREPAAILQDLTEEYVHAQLCEVALRAFAAENEARMAVMTAAHRQVERRMEELQAERRQLRQQEITAEIVELSAGVLRAGAGPQWEEVP